MTDKQIEELMNNSLITQVITTEDIANMSVEELKDYKYITNVIENNYFNDEQEAEQEVVIDDEQGVVVDDEQGVVIDDEQGVVVDDESELDAPVVEEEIN